MFVTTAVTGGFLAAINPMLTLLLSYDVFLLLNAFRVLNQTTEFIRLCSSKRHIYLNKLNFLGYHKEPKPDRISLQDIIYIGEYENKSLTLKNFGLLPSIARLMNKYKLGDKRDDEKVHDDGEFKTFYKFMANN